MPLQAISKEESAIAFHRRLQSLPPRTLIAYSDGSISDHGAASYGFTVHQDGRPGAEVFDAETTGALKGLQVALSLPGSTTQGIVVCLAISQPPPVCEEHPPTLLKKSS